MKSINYSIGSFKTRIMTPEYKTDKKIAGPKFYDRIPV